MDRFTKQQLFKLCIGIVLERTKRFSTNPFISFLKHLYKINITILRKQMQRGKIICQRSQQMRMMLRQYLVFPFSANSNDQDGSLEIFFLFTAQQNAKKEQTTPFQARYAQSFYSPENFQMTLHLLKQMKHTLCNFLKSSILTYHVKQNFCNIVILSNIF